MTEIKFKRGFKCDNSIANGIKWLNKHSFYTFSSCSGVAEDHNKGSIRDKLFIEFEFLEAHRINYVKSIAREVGFNIKNRKHENIVRLESEKVNRLELFNNFMTAIKKNRGGLNLRAMGISNWCFDKKNKKRYSVQFYDYDYNGDKDKIPQSIVNRIMEIFPYDCIMYETKQGVHFISFALLHGLNKTKSNVLKTTKDLELQDYWTIAKDLTLRVSAKTKTTYWGRRVISDKPKFKGVAKYPNAYRISNKHLEFYRKYMDLPDWAYNLYNTCDKYEYPIKIYHYQTRD